MDPRIFLNMLVITRTSHHHRRRLIHYFPGHPRRSNHQSNRLPDEVMDICRVCHRTSDCRPSSLLRLVAVLILPWLSSSVKCSISPKQSNQAAMVQESLIRSGPSSLTFCEMISSRNFLDATCSCDEKALSSDHLTTSYDIHAR